MGTCTSRDRHAVGVYPAPSSSDLRARTPILPDFPTRSPNYVSEVQGKADLYYEEGYVPLILDHTRYTNGFLCLRFLLDKRIGIKILRLHGEKCKNEELLDCWFDLLDFDGFSRSDPKRHLKGAEIVRLYANKMFLSSFLGIEEAGIGTPVVGMQSSRSTAASHGMPAPYEYQRSSSSIYSNQTFNSTDPSSGGSGTLGNIQHAPLSVADEVERARMHFHDSAQTARCVGPAASLASAPVPHSGTAIGCVKASSNEYSESALFVQSNRNQNRSASKYLDKSNSSSGEGVTLPKSNLNNSTPISQLMGKSKGGDISTVYGIESSAPGTGSATPVETEYGCQFPLRGFLGLQRAVFLRIYWNIYVPYLDSTGKANLFNGFGNRGTFINFLKSGSKSSSKSTVTLHRKSIQKMQAAMPSPQHGSDNIVFHKILEAITLRNEMDTKANLVVVSDFIFSSVIGEGSYGLVARCKKKSSGQQFAMKLQEKDEMLLRNEMDLSRVNSEALLLSSCRHPFIAQLYYALQTHMVTAMVTSYASNGDLQTYMHNAHLVTLPEQHVKFYISEIVLAVEHMHRKGIMHRDIKPANILLMDDGHVMLTDFGSAVSSAANYTLKVLRQENEIALADSRSLASSRHNSGRIRCPDTPNAQQSPSALNKAVSNYAQQIHQVPVSPRKHRDSGGGGVGGIVAPSSDAMGFHLQSMSSEVDGEYGAQKKQALKQGGVAQYRSLLDWSKENVETNSKDYDDISSMRSTGNVAGGKYASLPTMIAVGSSHSSSKLLSDRHCGPDSAASSPSEGQAPAKVVPHHRPHRFSGTALPRYLKSDASCTDLDGGCNIASEDLIPQPAKLNLSCNTIVGTEGYMAPEIAYLESLPYNTRTYVLPTYFYTNVVDWWSLGATAFKLLMGQKAVSADAMQAILAQYEYAGGAADYLEYFAVGKNDNEELCSLNSALRAPASDTGSSHRGRIDAEGTLDGSSFISPRGSDSANTNTTGLTGNGLSGESNPSAGETRADGANAVGRVPIVMPTRRTSHSKTDRKKLHIRRTATQKQPVKLAFKKNPPVSPFLRAFLVDLLDVNIVTRLGSGSNGATDVKMHKLFSDVEWNLLERKKVTPPEILPSSTLGSRGDDQSPALSKVISLMSNSFRGLSDGVVVKPSEMRSCDEDSDADESKCEGQSFADMEESHSVSESLLSKFTKPKFNIEYEDLLRSVGKASWIGTPNRTEVSTLQANKEGLGLEGGALQIDGALQQPKASESADCVTAIRDDAPRAMSGSIVSHGEHSTSIANDSQVWVEQARDSAFERWNYISNEGIIAAVGL